MSGYQEKRRRRRRERENERKKKLFCVWKVGTIDETQTLHAVTINSSGMSAAEERCHLLMSNQTEFQILFYMEEVQIGNLGRRNAW